MSEMPARLFVHITRTADGETRTVDYGVHPHRLMNGEMFERSNAERLWEEGNYACDCNRRLFFECVVHPEFSDFDAEPRCGDDAYDVRLEWREETPDAP